MTPEELKAQQEQFGTLSGPSIVPTQAPIPTPIAPIAGTSPAPTPITPAPIPTQQPVQDLSQNVTPVDYNPGQLNYNPAPPKPVDNSQFGPIADVTKTTKIENTANGTVKTDITPAPTVDPNIRKDQITTNLNEGLKNDPTVLQAINSGNWEQFKNKYNMQDPAEAKIVQDYFNSHIPTSPEGIFNLLASGQNQFGDSIKNSPAFKQAQTRFANLQKYSSYTTDNFQTALTNGDLLPGTQTYTDLVKDPNIKASLDKAQTLNSINGKKTDLQTIENTKATEIQNSPLGAALADNYLSPEEKAALINTPDLQAKSQAAKTASDEYNKLQAEYDNIETAVDEQVKGKGITAFEKSQMVANARKLLVKGLDLAQRNATTAYGFYKDARDESIASFADNLGLYKEKKAQDQAQAALKEQRTYDEQKAKTDLQNKFDYTYGDLKSTDPRIQQVAAERMATAIQEQYKGMPFRRDIATMGKDIAAAINAGQTTEQITTDITNAIQNAPDYANWKANNDKLAAPQTKYGFTEFDNKLYRTDDKGNASLIATGEKKAVAPVDIYENIPGSDGLLRNKLTGEIIKASDIYNSQPSNKPATPTGNYQTLTFGKKNLKVDSAGATPLQNALASFDGQGVIVGETFRSRERQEKLYNDYKNGSGILAAPPGQSKHESGLAIDIYSGTDKNGKLMALNQNQVAIMNQNGWYQDAGEGDKGHFTYYGTKGQQGGDNKQITDKQFTQYNQTLNNFKSQPGVAAFENALSSGGDLIASLKGANGPGDIGAVFQFMKTLDPASTVREGEFSLAAKSAGVWEQFKNIPANKIEGTVLTDEQRKAFGKLAFEYIKNKSKIYDVKYNDAIKVLKNQGIPDSYYPTKMSDYISQFETPNKSTGTSTPKKDPLGIF